MGKNSFLCLGNGVSAKRELKVLSGELSKG